MSRLALHSRHEALGATFGETSGQEQVLRYGPWASEYEAASERVALWDGSARQMVRVTGPDRVSFLQGMVTQDVEGLPEGAAAYTALLTAKGAMVADAR